jgi:two-component system invasion response regulator UvrY
MKILLVDDHAIVRTGLRRLLSMVSSSEIVEASTGKEGLAALKVQKFDVIVLDLNLPDLGGIELLTRFRQKRSM